MIVLVLVLVLFLHQIDHPPLPGTDYGVASEQEHEHDYDAFGSALPNLEGGVSIAT